ncbi:MAG: T9SS type A sorting domain-containing protein, partial [Balneola sp.]
MKKTLLLMGLIAFSVSAYAQIDYSDEIQPILTSNCNSCHSAGENNFNSSSYSAVIASTSPSGNYDKKHVIPNDADGSPLVDKIEANPQVGSRMPLGGQLTSEQVGKIRQWINEGATEEVAVSNEDEALSPKEFKLLGNYPNPFNPSTVIQFQSPISTNYRITVYNANGQLVSTIDARSSIGLNENSINLTNQTSGVYFYRIRSTSGIANSLIGTGKMTLI